MLMGAIAAWVFCEKDQSVVLMTVSAIAAIGCLWTWRACHRYAANLAQRRHDYTGEFYDITVAEADAIPDWIASVNFCFSVLSLTMLIIAIKI